MHKDITYCHARGCLLSDKCLRAQIPKDDEDVWYFSDEPFKYIDGKFDCAMYVGVNQIDIFEQLNDIVNGKNNTGGTKEDGHGGIKEAE